MSGRALRFLLSAPFAFCLLAPGVSLGDENYGARAEVRASDGKRYSAEVTISIERMATPEELGAILAAIRSGDGAKIRKALAAQPALGTIDRGRSKLPIKFASSHPRGKGKTVVMVCEEPLTYIGGDVPDVEPMPGFTLAYLVLSIAADGKGTGEIAPAATLRVREDGSVAVAASGASFIDLEDVARQK